MFRPTFDTLGRRTAVFSALAVVFATTLTWGQGRLPPGLSLPPRRPVAPVVVPGTPPNRAGAVKFVAGTLTTEVTAWLGQTVIFYGDADVYVGLTTLDPHSLPTPTRRNGFAFGFGRSAPPGMIHDSMSTCVHMANELAANPSSPRRLRIEFIIGDVTVDPKLKVWDGSQALDEGDLGVLSCALE